MFMTVALPVLCSYVHLASQIHHPPIIPHQLSSLNPSPHSATATATMTPAAATPNSTRTLQRSKNKTPLHPAGAYRPWLKTCALLLIPTPHYTSLHIPGCNPIPTRTHLPSSLIPLTPETCHLTPFSSLRPTHDSRLGKSLLVFI